MRFGYWMPVFGGWLRNVRDEGMTIAWPYIRDLAAESERHGFEIALIAELNLNDIKGHRAPSLDCWTLAPAVAAITEKLELMLAVRPNYHSPSLTAKALSTLDTIAPGRLSLNVVSSWWREEAAQYGVPFDVHDARYARTQEWLEVVHGCCARTRSPITARSTSSKPRCLNPSPAGRLPSTWAANRLRPRRSSPAVPRGRLCDARRRSRASSQARSRT